MMLKVSKMVFSVLVVGFFYQSFLYYVAKLENIFNKLRLSKEFSNINQIKVMNA